MTDAAEKVMQRDVAIEDAPMQRSRALGLEFLRKHGPVFLSTTGVYCVTSAVGVQHVLKHPKIFSNQKSLRDVFGISFDLIPIMVDPPGHVKYRRILDPLFSPRQLALVEDDLRRQAADLVDAFADRGRCDAMAELAKLFPSQVFLTLFGLPLDDRDMLIDWVRTIQGNVKMGMSEGEAVHEALRIASEALTDYLRSAIEDGRRERRGDGLLSQILAFEGEDAWSDEEVLGFAYLFMVAGLDTVTATMGFVLHHLAVRPDTRQFLLANPDRINETIEELLRLEGPVPFIPRVANEDAEVDGFLIPKGSSVLLALAAANRDPERFADPDAINLDQAEVGHFAFSAGIHRCVGSHLARRELRLVVDELLKRVPDFSIEGDLELEIEWPTGTMTFLSLPLVWTPQ